MPRPNRPFFSVIVPIYNVQQYAIQCIDSVLHQDFQDFELILVDDGSTDQSGEMSNHHKRRLVPRR